MQASFSQKSDKTEHGNEKKLLFLYLEWNIFK